MIEQIIESKSAHKSVIKFLIFYISGLLLMSVYIVKGKLFFINKESYTLVNWVVAIITLILLSTSLYFLNKIRYDIRNEGNILTKFQWLKFLFDRKKKEISAKELTNILKMDYLEINSVLIALEMDNLIDFRHEPDPKNASDIIYYLTAAGQDEYLEKKRTRDIEDKSGKRANLSLFFSGLAIVLSIISIWLLP